MAYTTAAKGAQTLENLVGGTFARKAAITIIGSLFLAALSQIQVPSYPVPVTLQTLAVMLIGLTFGFRLATATVALYLIEGLVGLPVFAGFSFGPAVFVGGTAGYLFGFLFAAALMGLMADRGVTRSIPGMVATLLAGEVVIFGLGIAYLTYLYGFDNALAYGLYPFLFADLVKMGLATLIGAGVIKGASRFAQL